MRHDSGLEREVITRKSRYSEQQIVGTLKRAEQGVAVKDICRELAISAATFHQWRSKYGGLEASELKPIKELEQENRRLKQMYADLSLDHRLLKDIVEKMYGPPRDCQDLTRGVAAQVCTNVSGL